MKKILVFGLVFFSFFMVFAACGDYYDQSCVDCYDCRTQYHEAPNKMTLAEAVKYCEKLGGGWSLANMCELRQRGYCRTMDACWSGEQLKFQGSCCEKEEGDEKHYYCKGARGWDAEKYKVICTKG